MLKKLLSLMMALCLASMPGLASAGETDLLIQKLVEKGILTPYEAQILQDDVKQDVNRQNAKGANEMLPSWIQTTKIKGDLRVRYQSQQREASTIRNRGRVRYRLGVETKPNDQLTVGAGLSSAEKASTTDDARSTNSTMMNAFDRGDIRLDYAYGQFKPNSWMSLTAGKYNALSTGNLWYTTDMMWDSDLNQEGASVHMDFADILGGDVFTNAGYWVLDEANNSNAGDPGMYFGQAGITFDPDPVTIKLAGTFYGVSGLTEHGALLDGRASGNTVSGTSYVYDFGQVFAGSAEMIYSWPAETSFPIKMAGIFGDYVVNTDPSDDDTGFAAGLKFGHAKVGAMKGDWQLKYQYVQLARDAWFDSFPDSDRYSGNTNVKAHEVILDIGLAKNLTLGLDYYKSEVLEGTPLPEYVFQADINMKF